MAWRRFLECVVERRLTNEMLRAQWVSPTTWSKIATVPRRAAYGPRKGLNPPRSC
jgi:hypothetical protein